ncbi:hypothetical protein [Flavobacterium sangjuense]|uniref:Uncharacterized protein n=1 Tax=Flavobacterium sangjuense TaxID=2518177 RepID=A0A4P7PV67_9FLAO|nr:hypothetical protein [Flavobacterium sangjuense]QBZ98595.1 hypothetical protein GS03_02104 [Flavobacterium sangjuense]
MKTTFLTLLLILGCNAFAQTHQLVKHDGTEHVVNYIKNENNVIYYSNPESQEQQKISSFAVASLKNLKTSNLQTVSAKVAVAAKCDFDKVIVLKQQDQTTGLKQAATYTGILNKTKGISSVEQAEQTIKSVKNKAAAKGYPFITVNQKADGTYEAVAYNY